MKFHFPRSTCENILLAELAELLQLPLSDVKKEVIITKREEKELFLQLVQKR